MIANNSPSQALIQSVCAAVKPLPDAARLLVGYSGGLDSTVLLHILVTAGYGSRILAVHVNHGLAAEADTWQGHCERQSDRWQVEFHGQSVQLEDQGQGLEASARQARYAVFANLMTKGDALLLGHHLDDQAETFILRLMRGAGVDGLAAMAAERYFQDGHLLRPLLRFTRAQLNHYALQEGLSWVEDPSNRDDRFDRNLVRNHIIPQLLSRWPAANTTLARSAELIAEASQLNQVLAAEDAQRIEYRPEKLGFSCDAAALAHWPQLRTANVIRHLLARSGLPMPSQAVMVELCTQIFSSRWQPEQRSRVTWGQVECVRYQHRAYVLPRLSNADTEKPLMWDGRQPLLLPDGSRLQLIRGGHFRWDGKPVAVHFGTAGWRSKPQDRRHSQQLKKVLQERELPPWWRQRLPLLVAGDRLAAVADLWVESDCYVSDSGRGYRVDWRYL